MEHRAIQVSLDIDGWPPVSVSCAYFKSDSGLTEYNRGLLAKVGVALSFPGIHVMGADWNFSPAVLEASDFLRKLGMRCVAPRRATCVTASSSSTLDYFLVSHEMYQMTAEVAVDGGHVPIPHRPVQLKLVDDAVNLEQLVFLSPMRLPTERPFGPRRPQKDWDSPTFVAKAALLAAKTASVTEAEAVLSLAYQKFANLAELEMAEQTDKVLAKT